MYRPNRNMIFFLEYSIISAGLGEHVEVSGSKAFTLATRPIVTVGKV
jgi:hypothetical protein